MIQVKAVQTQDTQGVYRCTLVSPAPADVVATHFDGEFYTYYQPGDELPAFAQAIQP